MTINYSIEEIFKILSEIPDPEIPVINIIELGILRDVKLEDDLCTITITPTYSGCPAMKVIEDDIKIKLKEIKKLQLKYFYPSIHSIIKKTVKISKNKKQNQSVKKTMIFLRNTISTFKYIYIN